MVYFQRRKHLEEVIYYFFKMFIICVETTGPLCGRQHQQARRLRRDRRRYLWLEIMTLAPKSKSIDEIDGRYTKCRLLVGVGSATASKKRTLSCPPQSPEVHTCIIHAIAREYCTAGNAATAWKLGSLHFGSCPALLLYTAVGFQHRIFWMKYHFISHHLVADGLLPFLSLWLIHPL